MQAQLRASWIAHSQILLNSYRQLLGRELIARSGDAADEAARLFAAPFAVLSHGTQGDPILNYGNQTALDLWEMTFEQLVAMPSRLTAEPAIRGARERFLQETLQKGFITGYSGVRISATGRRFEIENATIWNLTDATGLAAGQAAVFASWARLD